MPTTPIRPTRALLPIRVVLMAGLLVLAAFLAVGEAAAQESAPAESAPAQVLSNHSGTGPGPSGAKEARTPAQNERLYQSLKGFLMSPYCPGLTLGACGSGAAELLRADLREWVDAGYTRDVIVGYYASTFGEEFLGRPPFRGSAIVVWVAPIAAVLIGLIGIALWLKRAAPDDATERVDVPSTAAVETDDIDPETEARLEAEIRARYSG